MPLEGHVLTIGAVDLVKARHRNTARVGLRIRNELNAELLAQGWPGTAPFDVMSLILRFGASSKAGVEIDTLQTVRGIKMLPVAVQLAMPSIVAAQSAENEIEAIIRPRIVEAVNEVAERFHLRGVAA